MKITESQIRRIIREEAKRALQEMPYAGSLGGGEHPDPERRSGITGARNNPKAALRFAVCASPLKGRSSTMGVPGQAAARPLSTAIKFAVMLPPPSLVPSLKMLLCACTCARACVLMC